MNNLRTQLVSFRPNVVKQTMCSFGIRIGLVSMTVLVFAGRKNLTFLSANGKQIIVSSGFMEIETSEEVPAAIRRVCVAVRKDGCF
jgi:hypothetical protein